MIIGYLGIFFGFLVAPSQLIRLVKTKDSTGVSLNCYIFLVIAVSCYLVHAIQIKDPVFIIANGISVVVNSVILGLLIKYRR